MLTTFVAVAGCCVYISYRVGQVVSPTSRMLERRIAELEAVVARSEKHVREALERNREESVTEAKRLLQDSAEISETQARFVRKGLDDFSERLNGMRLDLARDSTRFGEVQQDFLKSLRESAGEDFGALARMQRETLEDIARQIAELGSDSKHQQELGKASLQSTGSDLKAAYAATISELRGQLAAHLAELREAVGHLGGTITNQGMQLEGVDHAVKTALREGAGKSDALNSAIEAQFGAFRAEASNQLAKLLAADARREGSWERLKDDFEAITRSLVQISRAVEVLKNELTVKLHDVGGSTDIDGLLERTLQPGQFERDVEVEPGTNRRVAYAVRLSDNPVTRVWLPIGILPVVQSYREFVAATVYNNVEGIKASSETFERAVLAAARDLSEKFVCPPYTLNLAVLYVPTDDLFEEIARRNSLIDALRGNLHVMVASASTLPTVLTGLRMALKGTSATTAQVANGSRGPPTATQIGPSEEFKIGNE
jgi:DNA recombination protein RmuC